MLTGQIAHQYEIDLTHWVQKNGNTRLHKKDPRLWTSSGEENWLGWLNLEDLVAEWNKVDTQVLKKNFSHLADIVLLGMGGSSLCPDVMSKTFGSRVGFPKFHILDSTDPAQIRNLKDRVDLAKTGFIVSSKSGSTLEVNLLFDYFFAELSRVLSVEKCGSRFVVITDPKSPLVEVAHQRDVDTIIYGLPSIGGRYSALSVFGLVPAFLMGLDIDSLFDHARRAYDCAPTGHDLYGPETLGVVLGAAFKSGRNKLSILVSGKMAHFGDWVEQLVAESTGKLGLGIVPVVNEPGEPAAHGASDRIFVFIKTKDADPSLVKAADKLQNAGVPIVTVPCEGPEAIGGEFYRWEVATAVAGSVMGINPFDQPDVESAKVAARAITEAFEKTGHWQPPIPLLETPSFSVYGSGLESARSIENLISDFLKPLKVPGYFGILAFLPMTREIEAELQQVRLKVGATFGTATTLGFGPRYLHSTGQLHKGGPKNGVFLLLTCDDANDLQPPGRKYSFGFAKGAQALGDFQVLFERGQRVLRIHLHKESLVSLKQLREHFEKALGAKS